MIALDSNLFIYVLENNREFGNSAATILRVAQGNGMASMFVYLELLSSALFVDPRLKRAATDFLDDQNLEYVDVNKEILQQAAALRAQFTPKIGIGDAIHLASALKAGADTFVTNDQDLVRLKIKGLNVVSL